VDSRSSSGEWHAHRSTPATIGVNSREADLTEERKPNVGAPPAKPAFAGGAPFRTFKALKAIKALSFSDKIRPPQ